jgi:hypothetical protein
MGRGSIASALLAGAAVLATFAFGVAPAAAVAVPPLGFRVSASHGYVIHGVAIDGDEVGGPDELSLFVMRRGGGAAYFLDRNVVVTETSISADLGALGSIELGFEPNGGRASEPSGCGSHRHRVTFESGAFTGHVDFVGEEGFAEAHSTGARREERLGAALNCESQGAVVGPQPREALLVLRRRGVQVVVSKGVSSHSSSRFSAVVKEREGPIQVERWAYVEGGGSAFDFDVPAQVALLRPPAPFSGSARFHRVSGHRGRLTGDLTVALPGRGDLSLTRGRGSLRWG